MINCGWNAEEIREGKKEKRKVKEYDRIKENRIEKEGECKRRKEKINGTYRKEINRKLMSWKCHLLHGIKR